MNSRWGWGETWCLEALVVGVESSFGHCQVAWVCLTGGVRPETAQARKNQRGFKRAGFCAGYNQ